MSCRETLLRSIAVFEKNFKCTLCMHDYCAELPHDILPDMHLNIYCTNLKKNNKKVDSKCRFFDQIQLTQHLKKQRKSFWKQCHLGLVEGVFPIWINEELSGCIFAGVFRGKISEDAVAPLISPGNKNLSCAFPSLPFLPEDQEFFFAFGEMIAAMIAVVSSQEKAFSPGAEKMLSEFFRIRHPHNIQLADAADFLQLTPARASDRIKREFGKGFSEVLRDYRMKTACQLLKNSMFSVEEIAHRCGFSSGGYFHRIFHRELRITPGEYRNMYQKNKS